MKKPKNGRIKIRKSWTINPKTRVREGKKRYSRKRNRRRLKKEIKEL